MSHDFRMMLLNSLARSQVVFDWQQFFAQDARIEFQEAATSDCLEWELSMGTSADEPLYSLQQVVENGVWETERENWLQRGSAEEIVAKGAALKDPFNVDEGRFPLVVIQHENFANKRFIMDGHHRAAERASIFLQQGVDESVSFFLLQHPAASGLLYDWCVRGGA